MKLFRFLISLSITLALLYALNTKIGSVPPLGKFLDPVDGFWANAESGLRMPERFQISGIQSPVSVLYDDMLVPHIFASDEQDLYAAVGYVHAFHRLWQMEFQTHAAAGRLSEIVGDLTLDMDRGQRRKGMTFGATNFMENLSPDAKQLATSYAKGVNTYINQLSYRNYPFEYKLLDYAPEEWTILKTGLLYKYMSDMLNSGEKDLENTNFRSIYGRELLDLIYPDVDNYQDAVVDKPNQWEFEAIAKQTPIDTPDETAYIDLVDAPNPNNGSNNWAVGPGKSATGNAMLCNDMHLSLYLPSLWFYTQLKCGDISAFGHTLPGIPMVITGFTDSIAWGFTNAQRDLVDWYKIQFEDEKMDKYLLDGRYVETRKKVEEIKIRGKDTYYDTVTYTVFGPVMYDRTYRSNSQKVGYARRWIDHDPSNALQMFYEINQAKSFDDYMNALNHFSSPAQNAVFTSASGDIAHRVQGKYPINAFEEGKFLKDGTSSANNWSNYIPNEHNAFWKNPERGFVSSANQHPADSTYPYYVTARSFEAYRNRRINDVLRADNSVSVEDLKNLHFDNYSMKAAESLPYLLAQLKGADLNAKEIDIVDKLSNWDYFFHAESKEATYYDIWFDKLYRSIWDEIRSAADDNVRLKYPTSYSTINLMKHYPDLEFFDHQGTESRETVADLVLMSFREMMTEIENMDEGSDDSWGSYKGTTVGHQLRIPALSSSKLNAGGNGGDVVNATGSTHGPSQRLIVELDPKGVKAWGHYPGGQSGNPGSRFYDSMIDSWVNGEYYDLLFLTKADAKHPRIIFTQTISAKQ